LSSEADEGSAEFDPSVRLRAFGFDDLHALWGGRSLWATDDLAAEVWVVDAAQGKRCFQLEFTPEDWAEVERLVGESGLLQTETLPRNRLPDEARATVTLVNSSGETVIKANWAGDRWPAFDRVFDHLYALADRSGG
jgi:hypothetical protein